MSLDVALTLRYGREGETKMLEEASAGIQKVDEAAKGAGTSVGGLADGIKQTATEAPRAATAVEALGEKAESSGGKFDSLKTLAIGAIGGIAGAFVVAGIDALFGAAMGAAIDYFDHVTNSSKNLKDDLEAHQGLVKDIKGLWDQAAGSASNYGLVSQPGLLFESQQNVGRLQSDFDSELARFVAGSSTLRGKVTSPFGPIIEQLRADLADGRADIIKWRDEISALAATLPLDSPDRALAEQFMGDSSQAAELQAALERAVDLFRALTGDAEAAAMALGASAEGMTATGTAASAALPGLREYADLIASMRQTGTTLPDGTRVSGTPGSVGGGFAAGGYTGHAPTDRIAGVVHGQEYVFDAAATRAIGVENLEAIRRGVRGYAAGGFVGNGTTAASGARGWHGMADDLHAARGAIRDFADELWQARSPIETLASVVKSASQSYLNRAIGAVGNVVETLIFGDVPGYALGTSHHPGGWAITGEAGPELVNLPRGAQVVPHRQSMAMLGGGPVNNFYIETPNPRAFAESRSSVARAAARLSGAAQRHV
jgi:hypothetical protein